MQSWDDGVVDDIRLAGLCREYGAAASFNLNPSLHGSSRGHRWSYRGKDVQRLARSELADTYAGFEIANHTATHPDLRALPAEQLVGEITDARRALQDWFGQEVDGFCYPFGWGTQAAQEAVEQAGHRFARRADGLMDIKAGPGFRFVKPHAHFTDPHLLEYYERARREDGYFFFWGHSYELMDEGMWNALGDLYRRIASDPDACWTTLCEYVRAVSAPA